MRNLLYLFLLCINQLTFGQIPFSIDSNFRSVLCDDMSHYFGAIADCIIEDDGKIVACGGFVDNILTLTNPCHLIRFNTDGSLDSSFHYQNPFTEGQTMNSGITRMAKHNGKYYICYRNYIGIARLFENGLLDTTFKFDFSQYHSGSFQIGSIYVDSLGRITLCGIMWRLNGDEDRIIRLNPDGSFDSTFHKSVCYYEMYKLIHLSSGKFLVGGWDSDPSITRSALWRIFPDGEIDTTFDTHCIWGIASDIVELPDHKILACGMFKLPEVNDTLGLCRFNENGSFDPSFNSIGAKNLIYKIGINFNKIILGGGFDSWHPNFTIKYNHFAILNLDGTLDTTLIGQNFGPDSSSHYYPPGIGIIKTIPGGKIYLGGYFATFAGYPSFGIVRLYDVSVGINDLESKFLNFIVFPNPTYNDLNIHFQEKFDGFLELRDMFGRLINKLTVNHTLDDYQINLSNYKSGIYYIRLLDNTSNLSCCKKIVVL